MAASEAVPTSAPPPPRSHHVARGGAKREEGAVEIDLEHAPPLLAAHLDERGAAAAPAHAGVGKAAVDAAQHARASRRSAASTACLVGDVAFERQDLAAGLGQLGLGGGVLGRRWCPRSPRRRRPRPSRAPCRGRCRCCRPSPGPPCRSDRRVCTSALARAGSLLVAA